MDTKTLLIALTALVVGAGGGYIGANTGGDNDHRMPDGSTMHGAVHSNMQGEMNTMMSGLSGKTGDDFDKAFLSEMIVHHEGAVEMAKAALEGARHQELKDMANAIITAQTAEITQMKQWQRTWYGQ